MTREELRKFKDWWNLQDTGHACITDVDIDNYSLSLPPAEGAEDNIEALLKQIDKDVEKPMVTAQFGDMWRAHAVDHYDFPSLINIAWKQGRKALLLEKELRATLHAQKIADKMVEDMRQKLFSMRSTKKAMDKLSEADRLMMYGYHDCINEMLMWTKSREV